MKWSWNTKTLVTLGDCYGSKGVSMLVKSTCRRSRGAVAMVGCKGALGMLPSCGRQHVQFLIACDIWMALPGHQRCSCSKNKVWSWPWCPASGDNHSEWHPDVPLGQQRVLNHHSPPWVWCIGRGLFGGSQNSGNQSAIHTRGMLSQSVFRSIFYWVSSQSNKLFSTGSSLCILAQSVTCISTNTHPVATCYLFFLGHSHLQLL